LRYAVMDLLRFGRLIDDEALAAMQEGSARHRVFQRELAQTADLMAVEQPVKDDGLQVSGRMDAVVEWRGQPMVVEFKTVNQERFDQIREQGPLVSHFAQLALYLELTGYAVGVLVVESRVSNRRLRYVFERDPAWASWLRERIQGAVQAAEAHRLPARETSVACLHCDRWQRCFAEASDREQAVAAHPRWEPNPAAPGMPQGWRYEPGLDDELSAESGMMD
jgi:hypothetical protein